MSWKATRLGSYGDRVGFCPRGGVPASRLPPPPAQLVSPSLALGAAAAAASLAGGIPPLWGELRWTVELG